MSLSRMTLTQYLYLFQSTFLVSESSNATVGFAVGGVAFSGVPEIGWILDVAVAPPFQGRRIGPTLCEHVVAALNRLGVRKIYATVAPENARSLQMLLSMKFHVTDDVADYFGPGQRRLLVERHEEGEGNA